MLINMTDILQISQVNVIPIMWTIYFVFRPLKTIMYSFVTDWLDSIFRQLIIRLLRLS